MITNEFNSEFLKIFRKINNFYPIKLNRFQLVNVNVNALGWHCSPFVDVVKCSIQFYIYCNNFLLLLSIGGKYSRSDSSQSHFFGSQQMLAASLSKIMLIKLNFY